jgi:hypothetical protein
MEKKKCIFVDNEKSCDKICIPTKDFCWDHYLFRCTVCGNQAVKTRNCCGRNWCGNINCKYPPCGELKCQEKETDSSSKITKNSSRKQQSIKKKSEKK